jgi:cytochrome P450
VVIAPDQVHTNDDEAMKTIYDRSAIKSSFYPRMGSWKGITTTLGILDYADAAPTRSNLLNCFQNRNLQNLAENISTHVKIFVQILQDKTDREENVNGVLWYRLLALDIVTDVLWGESSNLLASANDSTNMFLRRFHAFSKYNALRSFIPGFDFYVRNFGSQKWKSLRADCDDMDVTAREALERWSSRENKVHDRDVLSMLLGLDPNAKSNLPIDHLPAYLVEMMAAGSSTTSHTGAFVAWSLTRHPDIQRKLRQELFDAYPDPSNIDLKSCQNLPFLDAVIRETMRMYPMIPGPLERHLGTSITVDGHTIPPGIIASTSAYTQGRLESVYRNASEWNPQRWPKADARMKLNWIPFGYGSRSCPGANLAVTELKSMTAAVFRGLKAVPPTDVAFEEKLELADVFAAGTKSGVCWLRFESSSDKVW